MPVEQAALAVTAAALITAATPTLHHREGGQVRCLVRQAGRARLAGAICWAMTTPAAATGYAPTPVLAGVYALITAGVWLLATPTTHRTRREPPMLAVLASACALAIVASIAALAVAAARDRAAAAEWAATDTAFLTEPNRGQGR
ncbi:hypothetical protein [Thermobispora bispora]|uniref:hypothetical protein n=1 Tax=Thermobispora bispora TaxID=2006 RepID=UPI00197D1455|nr:hypothetical protein [Thermobispora bispora]QSI49965.1 hypothetical protein CYL17_18485 [Thermobispora bispora]